MSAVAVEPTLERPLQRPRRLTPRSRLDKFPSDPLLRWVLRLAFAIPYLLTAGVASATDATLALATPNQALIDHLATIEWDRADPQWMSQIFPPITTLLAAVIPGGRAGLTVAGALVAGIFLQKLLEIMVQRRFPPSTIVILTLAIGANPLFAYVALENFPAFLGLCLFGIAASDLVRFISWRDTRSGFRAGMLLMLATLSDLSGMVYVLIAAVAAPFLRLARAEQKGARGANVLVIVYPTVAAIASIALINWIFTGRVLGELGRGILAGTPERLTDVSDLLFSVTGLFLVAPVLSAWLMALVVRRPGAVLVSALVFAGVLLSMVLGLISPTSAGNTFILMTVLAIALIPTAKERATIVMIDILAVVQIAIAWGTAFHRESVIAWMTAVAGAFAG